MPPWIYSDGFWRNLWEVMFPHQWLLARTAGISMTHVVDAPETTDHNADNAHEPMLDDDKLATRGSRTTVTADNENTAAGMAVAHGSASSTVKRRRTGMVT